MQTLGQRVGSGEERLDERVDVLGRALWGMSIGCVRCHDHKFDPIYRPDYLSFVGIFQNSSIQERLQLDGATRLPPEFDKKLTAALQSLRNATSKDDGKLRADFAKVGVTYAPGMTAAEVLPGIPEQDRAKVKQLFDAVEKSAENARKALAVELDWPSAFMGIKEETTNIRSMMQETKTEKGMQRVAVPRGMVRVMLHGETPAIDQKKESGRLQVARWAASDQHPLTARVFVNRVWSHLLGQGIVSTVDNFGATGEPPTHPELLDTLAVQFMHDGWSVKKLVRRIVLSRTYQLSSHHDKANAAIDERNQYCWRASRRRLEAEAINDAILSAAGRLNPKAPPALVLAAGLSTVACDALDLTCRAVYLPVMRDDFLPLFKTFDAAEPTSVVGSRGSTNVPTQALFMLNSNLVLRSSRHLAERLLTDPALKDDDARLRRTYLLTYGRPARADEVARDKTFLAEWKQSLTDGRPDEAKTSDAWSALCQTLFAAAEFRYID
jgi:hypothetical protein